MKRCQGQSEHCIYFFVSNNWNKLKKINKQTANTSLETYGVFVCVNLHTLFLEYDDDGGNDVLSHTSLSPLLSVYPEMCQAICCVCVCVYLQPLSFDHAW